MIMYAMDMQNSNRRENGGFRQLSESTIFTINFEKTIIFSFYLQAHQ